MRSFSIPRVVLSVLCSLQFAPAQEEQPRQQRPVNVIFLLVDDWGWRDAGCFGSDLYQTPNIDRLAAKGMKFTNAYAACTVCSPTRAAAMTGMYPARTHVTDWIPGHARRNAKMLPPKWTQHLEHRHSTIAEILHGAKYRTAHVGKWHLTPRSSDPKVVGVYYPERHGFDVNIAGNQWGAPGSYHWPFVRKRRNRPAIEGLQARVANFPKGGKKGDYLTDTLTEHALRFIEENAKGSFFLYFPYYNVHTPIQGRADLTKRYRDILAKRSEKGGDHTNAAYAAMVTAVDESVGRILATLTRLGIEDRTVVILTGDNGGLDRKGNPTENAPLRAGKGSAYEGGVRVPCVIHAPGITKPGSVSDEPIITVDFYPTIQALTGVKGVAAHNASVDGMSLLPVMKDATAKLDRDAIYWHYPHYHPGGATPYSAIRSRDWKLVEFYEGNRAELFHLSEDIGETKDLAAAMPERAASMRKRLEAWRKSVGAQSPRKNPKAKRGE
jgi:arylsulfatase A-like enzyme